MDKHHINALKVAKFLAKQKKVSKVYYPYKKNSQIYQLWKKYYSGASGLMGLRIKSKNKKSVKSFVNSLKLFGYGYSWGGFESLALYQNQKQHYYLNQYYNSQNMLKLFYLPCIHLVHHQKYY